MKADYARRVLLFRAAAVLTIAWGIYYLFWRYTASLNPAHLWLSLILVLCETYSLGDTLFFVLMMWKPARREPPSPFEASVDVFILTYNEPVDLVRLTVDAAMRIDWTGKKVHLLDDGAREEMRALAAEYGCGYIRRGAEWQGKLRHAKAGNINNALLQTSGEFILVLDADQIPAPTILKRTLGYFGNAGVAFVQTPQYFYNMPPGDPFGADAPIFYGPVQQGKDGWNAATFCGSNAVLRREALMQLGLTRFVQDMEEDTRAGIARMQREARAFRARTPLEQAARIRLRDGLKEAAQALRAGGSLQAVSDMARRAVTEAQRAIARQDLESIAADLEALGAQGDAASAEAGRFILENQSRLAEQTAPTEPQAVGISGESLADASLSRDEDAIAIHALSTISVTEDTATALRLHALGWESVFHGEILAYGLTPEDLGSALKQRLRWAQGTIQVFLHENPLGLKGLSPAQRLLYFNMAYSYFGGFVNLCYVLIPVLYLFSGLSAVNSWSMEFLARLVPLLVLNRILYQIVTRGLSVWRSEQYSLALFPVWIQAVLSVLTGRSPSFVVTPKQRRSGNYLSMVWPQLTVIGLSAAAGLYGIYSAAAGLNPNAAGVAVNVFWCGYNIVLLSAIVRAALYRPPADWLPRPPEFLFPLPKP